MNCRFRMTVDGETGWVTIVTHSALLATINVKPDNGCKGCTTHSPKGAVAAAAKLLRQCCTKPVEYRYQLKQITGELT